MPRIPSLAALFSLLLGSCILDTTVPQETTTSKLVKPTEDTILALHCQGCLEQGIASVRLHVAPDTILTAPVDSDGIARFRRKPSSLDAYRCWFQAGPMPVLSDSSRSLHSIRHVYGTVPALDTSLLGDTLLIGTVIDSNPGPVHFSYWTLPYLRHDMWNYDVQIDSLLFPDQDRQIRIRVPRLGMRPNALGMRSGARTLYRGYYISFRDSTGHMTMPNPWWINASESSEGPTIDTLSDTAASLHCLNCHALGIDTVQMRIAPDSTLHFPLDSVGTASLPKGLLYGSPKPWFLANNLPLYNDSGWSTQRTLHVQLRAFSPDSVPAGDSLLEGILPGPTPQPYQVQLRLFSSRWNYEFNLDTTFLSDSSGKVTFRIPRAVLTCMRRPDLDFWTTFFGVYGQQQYWYSQQKGGLPLSASWP